MSPLLERKSLAVFRRRVPAVLTSPGAPFYLIFHPSGDRTKNFPPSPTRRHGSVMISMQARARFEKILKKIKHPRYLIFLD